MLLAEDLVIVLSMIEKLWSLLDGIGTYPMRIRHKHLMDSDPNRNKSNFLQPYLTNVLKTQIAEDVWLVLIKWSPLKEDGFAPSLEDRFDDDYFLADEDLEDLVRDLLKDKNYFEPQIEEPIKVATPAELIDYLAILIAGK